MVPEQEGEAQEGHGGAEEGRGKRETLDGAQELLGECAGLGYFEEEGNRQ